MKNKKGFTLIEVLVVVLIAGILSTLAVPQYMKTVERSRATEALNMVKSINDAVYAYAAGRSNAACPTSFRKLSVTVPVSNDNVSEVSLKHFRYKLGAATNAHIPGTNCPGVTATRINGGRYEYVIWHPYRAGAGRARLGCYSPTNVKASIELCSSLGLYVDGATPIN